MRVVCLQGGLGNQLFQYAFARSLECRYGIPVKFDDSFFQQQSKRIMCLGNFDVKLQIGSDDEILDALKLKPTIIERFFGFTPKTKTKNSICTEKSLSYSSVYYTKKHKTYFRGYWQNEKYFKTIEEIIRRELIIVSPPSEQNAMTIDLIKRDNNSVSLHVRRGDYISEIKTNQIHGICGMDYYHRSLRLLESKLGCFNLYIFSDDINWVKENFQYSCNKVFVNWNDESSNYEDLRLMSLCKHNIIANSSFSWWGAWLNQNPDKIVIAPKQWFADPIKNEEAKDIVPVSWIKL